jgi:DNA-binding NarL/FixJ family response regulator
VLLVDDFVPWRRFASATLQRRPELQVIGEAFDGLEAVQKAQALQPDLVLLDIGLPKLNGIEAARRIREVSSASKILFVSENRSVDIAEEALSTGANGYVVKSDAARELIPAVNAVLCGKHFVSASLSGNDLTEAIHLQTGAHPRNNVVIFTPPQKSTCHHDVMFYFDDRDFLDSVTRFIGPALNAGDAAIVVATESHRDNLLPRLHAYGVDMGAAIKQGRYVTVDAAEAISSFVVNGTLDAVRFLDTFANLIQVASKAAEGERRRVVIFGEGVHLLWAQGNVEAAIEDERLCNQLVKMYNIDILCGYGLGFLSGGMEPHIYRQICEEHSGVYSR